jgi:murein DD-endopeptidase MepM/ murein hydrolase activator NlpD
MRRRRALPALISLSLAILLLSAPLAHAVSEADLRAHQEAAREAREAAAAAEAAAEALSVEVEALDRTIASLMDAVNTLSVEVAEATKRTDRLKAEVDDLQSQINTKQREIDETQVEYDHQRTLLAGRVQETYKNGDIIYFELLLESRSIDDLITRTALVQRVIRSNAELALDLKAMRIALEKARAELERDLETVDAKHAEAQAEEDRVRELRAEEQSKLAAQQSAQQQKANLVAQNEANAERLLALAAAEEAESAKIARELSGVGSGVYNGIMAWPVPGYYRITSYFGYRTSPIFGGTEFHSGIDIGTGGQNPPIVAASDGTVIFVGYRGGYGNTVIIDHGNGVTTLYAHMLSGSFKVSKDQSVSRNQMIGNVGSTGYSTGEHLHFEVRINGTPVDPLKYLK